MLEKLNGAQYIVILDLASGYLHIPLSEGAKENIGSYYGNAKGRI